MRYGHQRLSRLSLALIATFLLALGVFGAAGASAADQGARAVATGDATVADLSEGPDTSATDPSEDEGLPTESEEPTGETDDLDGRARSDGAGADTAGEGELEGTSQGEQDAETAVEPDDGSADAAGTDTTGSLGGPECDPSYPDECIPPSSAGDVNCTDDGIPDNITVTGDDPHGLDADDDGVGCEADGADDQSGYPQDGVDAGGQHPITAAGDGWTSSPLTLIALAGLTGAGLLAALSVGARVRGRRSSSS